MWWGSAERSLRKVAQAHQTDTSLNPQHGNVSAWFNDTNSYSSPSRTLAVTLRVHLKLGEKGGSEPAMWELCVGAPGVLT